MDSKLGAAQWLEKPRNRKRLWWAFAALLVLSVAAEWVLPLHPHFGIDGILGFHAWFSFGACAAMIVVAKLLAVLLKRSESYGGRRDD